MKSKEQKKTPGGGKKLRDYSAVPGTPPPEQRKDREVAHLEKEVDKEKTYLSILERENKEIEKILQDLEKELNYVKYSFPQKLDGDGKIHADNEYWFKYEAQMEVNRKLEKERRHLESEIKQMEEQGMINLDSLTQSELILYVKQLERTKTDLLSDLRAKEWSLDKQAKDYHHLNETKKALEAEIKHYDGEHALFHHYKRISCPSASRQNSQKSSARRGRIPRSKEGGRLTGVKASSVSNEDIPASSARDLMFRSLDETKLEELKRTSPVEHQQRRLTKEDLEDGKKKIVKKEGTKRTVSVGSLPELPKQQNKTQPTTLKTVRSRSEHSVNRSRSRPSTARPRSSIKIIVTDESERCDEASASEMSETPITGRSLRTESGNESGIGSPSDYAEDYEDDFEESDADTGKETKTTNQTARKTSGKKRFGSATWRA